MKIQIEKGQQQWRIFFAHSLGKMRTYIALNRSSILKIRSGQIGTLLKRYRRNSYTHTDKKLFSSHFK